MAFSNPEHKADPAASLAKYLASFHATKTHGMEYFFNATTGKHEALWLGTPTATWTRISEWCKEQNITVEQLANILEKQRD